MKKSVLIFMTLAVFSSCKQQTDLLPSITGKVNEILVIANKNLWNSPVGDTLRAYFQQEQDGLPQAEPVFDMLNLPEKHFIRDIKVHRNILQISISPDVDSATIKIQNNPWAKTQKYVRITAPNVPAFYQIFNANKTRLMALYTKAERERLMTTYKRTADTKIFNLFKKQFNLLLYCPTGYYINKDTAGFVWISSETKKDSRGLCFFTEPYTHEQQLTPDMIINRVNSELEKFIPGPLDGVTIQRPSNDPAYKPGEKNEKLIRSYMQLDLSIPYTVNHYQYNGHYAIFFRGLWTVTSDFMAGPYILNVVLDEANNRILYLMGYVYNPNEKKRDMVKQLEAILNSLVLDIQPQEKKK